MMLMANGEIDQKEKLMWRVWQGASANFFCSIDRFASPESQKNNLSKHTHRIEHRGEGNCLSR